MNILGCGSALPTMKRNPTSQLVYVQERQLLLDCGEGTQLQLRKYKLKFHKINHIFISHLHGDHYFGLMGLLSSFSLLGRKSMMSIYAPKQLNEILKLHFKKGKNELDFKINFIELNTQKEELILDDGVIEVRSFPVVHRIKCCGFSIKEKIKQCNIKKSAIEKYNISIEQIVNIKQGADFIYKGKIILNKELTENPPKARKYSYCADTKYSESIIPYIENSDLLYHEATFLENMRDRAKATYHSTAIDAAKIARKAEVKKLLLGHYSARYKDLSEFENEAKPIFSNVVTVKDGDVFRIELNY